MSDIFNLTDTWNNGATAFSAIKMAVTDTASDAASKLIDLQVGGASKFSVSKDGSIVVAGGAISRPLVSGSGGTNFSILTSHSGLSTIFEGSNGVVCFGIGTAANTQPGAVVPLANYFGWYDFNNTTPDTTIKRTSAGVVSSTGTNGAGVGYFRTPATTVASLLAAATAGAGARSFVTDATVTTFASTVAGGGGNAVPVYSDGTNWKIG